MQAVKILKTLWKVIKIVMLVTAILFFLLIAYIYLAIQISPLSKFPYVKDRDLAKFEALTNTKGETLLIYRKKPFLIIVGTNCKLASVTRIL